MGGVRKRLESWTQAVGHLFEMSAQELPPLDELVEDLSCWMLGELDGTRVIRFHNERLPSTHLVITRADANLDVPLHHHEGRETMVVLEGGFTSDTGRRLGPGDSLVNEPGVKHWLKVDPEGCLCAMRIEAAPVTSSES
jgi:anti-sigma factor ChrR (cupin superfamily)